MANYNTHEVVTHPVRLTAAMKEVLTNHRGAILYQVQEANALDGLVDGALLHTYHITFENGWADLEDDLEEGDDENDGEENEEEPANRAEVLGLRCLSKEDFFHEVLKVNPDLSHIELQAAWTCSRMRLDGFGGSSLHVTRKGFLYVTTTNVVVKEDGTALLGSTFTPFAS